MSHSKNNQLMDENNNFITDVDVDSESSAKKKIKHDHASFSYARKRQSKQTVFDFDSNELYELFLNHGIPEIICDSFLKFPLNGEQFKSWLIFSDYTALKEFVNNTYKLALSEHQARHLFAILKRYHLNPYSSKDKVIADNVHGQISVHPLLMKIIDTPQFQRLRYIKQLGCLCHVYPTGNHTRFEHSIGTSHIAGIFMEHLSLQRSLQITKADELCVRIAGLCHDLGHGPFSHMFEEVVKELCPNTDWKHEMATLMMFDKILKETENLELEFESYGLFENDRQLIKDIIYAPVFKGNDPDLTYTQRLLTLESLQKRGIEKSFLFEIISNNRNGIDVDKFDYFERDSKQMGFNNNFNFKRYIKSTRVIKTDDNLNQICCRDKDIQDLYEMFHVRELLTRRAYKHETGSSINLMYVEALVKADKYFKFSEMIQAGDINRFEKFTDSVEETILHSTCEDLKESREILERASRRKLYKYVGYTLLPDDKNKDSNAQLLKENLMKYFISKSGNEVNPDNTVIDKVCFNYSFKNKNPLEHVRCYNKHATNHAFKLEKDQISGMLLTKFEDVVIRVYSKKVDDYEFFDRIHELFNTWCKENNLSMLHDLDDLNQHTTAASSQTMIEQTRNMDLNS